jgi:hypothetical protein
MPATLNYPNARPSLLLNFARSRQLDPRITFTRASIGTFYNSAGILQTAAAGQPRFDFNPTTLASQGLLIEEARSNLLLRSAELATSPWFNATLTSIANNTLEVLAPDGTNTATKIVSLTGGAIGQGATLTAAVHTGSIWLRTSSGTISAALIIYLAASPFTNIGSQSITITTTWQRFTVTSTAATATGYNFQINGIAAGTVYAWGAQLEAGAFATSHIPTVASQVTRAADLASITGTNFSSWFNASQGTFVVTSNSELDRSAGAFRSVLQAIKTSTYNSDSIFVYRNFIGLGVGEVRSASTAVASIATSTAVTRITTAFAYAVNDFSSSTNGATVGTDTAGALPTGIDKLVIGAVGDNNVLGTLNGSIEKIAYYSTRLSNAQLQSLSA